MTIQVEKVTRYIVDWLNDYKSQAHCKGFVIGVSGGIDSAVTSFLCALTKSPVICLEMPIYQHPNQINRARKHIEFLESRFDNVTSLEINLTPVFGEFLKSIPEYEEEEKRFLSLANTRARFRMSTLYYFAGIYNSLVVGTGNKVEDFGVGFFTKYGDGGVDLSPIAGLMKSEVYAIGKHLGVIEEILAAPPTDGLWGDDRTDEDQIGATYNELEWAMNYSDGLIEKKELNLRENEVLAIYQKLHAQNQHKMIPIPVCEIPSELKG